MNCNHKVLEEVTAGFLKNKTTSGRVSVLQKWILKLSNEVHGVDVVEIAKVLEHPLNQNGAYVCHGAGLNELHKVQQQFYPTHSSYYLVDTGITLRSAPKEPLTRGTLHLQKYSRNPKGIIVVEDHMKEPQLLGKDRQTFNVPVCIPAEGEPVSLDLQQHLESLIDSLEKTTSPAEYLIAAAHSPDVRENLGFPETGLGPGSRLMSTAEHYPGIHSEYLYISPSRSVAAVHREDFCLGSANVLYEGAPKLWLIIDTGSTDRFETLLARELRIEVSCSQFIRHQSIVLRPSLLQRWKIKFYIVRQLAGYMMLVINGAYHYVINEGANIAGAINYADADWDIPPLYRECRKGNPCTGKDIEPIRASGFHFGEDRELDVDTSWEIPETTLSLSRARRQKVSIQRAQLKPKSRSSDPVHGSGRREKHAVFSSLRSRNTVHPENIVLPNNNDRSTSSPLSSVSVSSESLDRSHSSFIDLERQKSLPADCPDTTRQCSTEDEQLEATCLNQRSPESDTTDSPERNTPKNLTVAAGTPLYSPSIDQLYEQLPAVPKKRSSDTISQATIPSTAKRFQRSPFLDISPTNKASDQDHLQNLKILGSDWVEFYTAHTGPQFPASTIYRILALVSGVGSPSVLLDVADMCRSFERPMDIDKSMSSAAKAYWLYNRAEASILNSHALQRLTVVFLHEQYTSLVEHYRLIMQVRQKEQHNSRRRKNSQPSKPTIFDGRTRDARSYALDDLVAYCTSIPLDHRYFNSKSMQAERKKISGLRREGEALSRFKEYLGNGYSFLLPLRQNACLFDDQINIELHHYLELRDKELEIFLLAYTELRPGLAHLRLHAARYASTFYLAEDGSIPRIKLHNMDPDFISKQQLDSDVLLSSFDPVELVVP